jgi:hypothetical protein
MKTTLGIVALLVVFGVLGYGCYRKGLSDGTRRAASAYNEEYGNDWNSDPAVKHSASYSMGYSRGHASGYGEAHLKDFDECGDQLARVVIETRNAKIGGRLLAEGVIAPSQLQKAESQYRPK